MAKTCNIHRTTIHYWKRSSTEFADTLHDACWENADHWRAASNQRAEAALALIDTFLSDPKTPATVRLKAALHILNAATAPPPKFEYTRQDDPYRAGHQLLAQMRADEAERLQYLRDNKDNWKAAKAAPLPDTKQNSSQFITSNNTENKKEARAAPLPDSSQFITVERESEYAVKTIRHPEPPTPEATQVLLASELPHRATPSPHIRWKRAA